MNRLIRWLTDASEGWDVALEKGGRWLFAIACLSVAIGLLVALVLVVQATRQLTDRAEIPPELADHAARGGGLERGESVGAQPSDAIRRYPEARFYGSPNWSGRGSNPIEAIVIHVTGPGTCPGMRSWFANPSSQVSAHFGVCKDGSVEQYVEAGDVAWHAGICNRPSGFFPTRWCGSLNPNLRTIGIEVLLAGPAEPLEEFPEGKAALIALVRFYAELLGIPIDRDHIIGHYEIDAVRRASDPICCIDLDSLVAELRGEEPAEPLGGQAPECPSIISYDREQALWSIIALGWKFGIQRYTNEQGLEDLYQGDIDLLQDLLCKAAAD